MNCTRRPLAFLFPALGSAQQTAPPFETLPSAAFPLEHLKERKSGTIELYRILTGKTHIRYKFGRVGEMEVFLGSHWTRIVPGCCSHIASNDLRGYGNPVQPGREVFRPRVRNQLSLRSVS